MGLSRSTAQVLSTVVPPDAQSIFSALRSLQTSSPLAYNAIVRPANPPAGIGGFLFDIPDDEEIRLRSQITNYFLENNTSIQDNITVEPAVITLRGVIAELSLGIPLNPPTAQSATVNPLIPAMMPVMTPQQQEAYAEKQQQAALTATAGVNQAAANGTSQSLYAYYLNQTGAGNSLELQQLGLGAYSKQRAAFLYFQQLQAGQQLCSVETPFGIYEQCGILEVRAIQDGRTRYMSEFTVTFQEMRFAGDATVQTGNLAGRTALALSPVTQDGNAGQTPSTIGTMLGFFIGGLSGGKN